MSYLRQLPPTKYGIILLTLFTAVIHLALGQPLFIVNGLGYLALLGALLWPRLAAWQPTVRWLLIGYTGVTIIAYFVVHRDGSWQMDGLGLMTKVAEIILILLLLYELQPPPAEA